MSTLEQLKGDSRRRQLARAKAYAEKHQLEIVDRFDDWGVSAFRGKNLGVGALKVFKDKLDAGEIERGSYLIVESMDRLSRDKVVNALTLLTEIVSKGVVLVTLDDDQVYSEATIGEGHYRLLIALASMSRAHEESRRKSNLLGEAWSEKKRLARQEGRLATRRVPGWLQVTEEGVIEPIPDRVAVVREVFNLARDGWGTYSICRRLNKRNEPVWSGRKHAVWRESYLKKMLKSRTVLGEYQPHRIVYADGLKDRLPDGDPIVGYYPAVISNELFLEANAAVARRRVIGKGRKGKQYANLFSGLLQCSCGAGYRYINKGAPPKGGTYLQCSVSYQKGACSMRAIRYEIVESTLLHFIESLDIGRVLGGQAQNKKLLQLRTEVASLSDSKGSAEAVVARVINAIAEGEGPTSKALLVKLKDAELEIERLNTEIERKTEEVNALLQMDPKKRQKALAKLFNSIRGNEAQTDVTRRALVGELQRLLKRVVVRPAVKEAWEIADANPNWRQAYGVSSQSALERIARDASFELILVYHDGDIMIVDAMEGPYFKTQGRVKFKEWTFLSREEGA